jgi:hypothetical protein
VRFACGDSGVRRFFFVAPLFIAYAGVFNDQVERLTMTQPINDATFASLLCQGSAHLFNTLL